MTEQMQDIVVRYSAHAVDITEQVKMMYDALINSVDWGSEFLDTETKGAVLAIGNLFRFEVPMPGREYEALHASGWTETPPVFEGPYTGDNPALECWSAKHRDFRERQEAHLRKWMAEAAAQAAAKLEIKDL